MDEYNRRWKTNSSNNSNETHPRIKQYIRNIHWGLSRSPDEATDVHRRRLWRLQMSGRATAKVQSSTVRLLERREIHFNKREKKKETYFKANVVTNMKKHTTSSEEQHETLKSWIFDFGIQDFYKSPVQLSSSILKSIRAVDCASVDTSFL